MFAWKVRSDSGFRERSGTPFVLFTVGLLTVAVAAFGIDSVITARALHADPHGYPVRLLIPEPPPRIVKRPPPRMMGQNVELISAALADEDRQEGTRNSINSRHSSTGFDKAFNFDPDLSPSAPIPGRSGMLSIDFNLKGGAQSDRAISVQKPVTVAGEPKGRLSIRIDGAAKIYVSKTEMAELLSKEPEKSKRVSAAAGQDYVSFDQLRIWGVNIRYDPSSDRIVIPAES